MLAPPGASASALTLLAKHPLASSSAVRASSFIIHKPSIFEPSILCYGRYKDFTYNLLCSEIPPASILSSPAAAFQAPGAERRKVSQRCVEREVLTQPMQWLRHGLLSTGTHRLIHLFFHEIFTISSAMVSQPPDSYVISRKRFGGSGVPSVWHVHLGRHPPSLVLRAFRVTLRNTFNL